MTLYLIGIGLNDEKDITVKGLEIVKKADKIYLENYTSLLQCKVEDLEQLYQNKVIIADREMSEQGAEKIVEEAKNNDVVFLVIGDPFSATTHHELQKLAMETDVPFIVINNASVITAISVTGLQLYKFGKTTSIPYLDDFPQLETPYNDIKRNKEIGLHTLCLLDIKKDINKFMTVNESLKVLQNIEERKQEHLISDEMLVIGCSRLGSANAIIKSGKLKEILQVDFGKPPHCLIIPGNLHFLEKEFIEAYN